MLDLRRHFQNIREGLFFFSLDLFGTSYANSHSHSLSVPVMNIKVLFLSGLLFLLPTASAANPTDPQPVKPSVSVSFSRQVIRENGSTEVELWMTNDSDHQLFNVEMHVAGADFLQWHEDSCEGKVFTQSIGLGSIDAHSSLRRHFCVTTTSEIKVGEFNTLFTFQYQWQTDKGLFNSVVTLEKSIKSNIFGSDNVAGIPLAFAGFVVPGLFFWFVIHFFRAPWNVGVALGDKLIYSVLVSICIVGVGQWITPIDVSDGISLDKLIRLAGVGALLGVVAGGTDYSIRGARRRRVAAREIAFGDDEQIILGKLLQLNPEIKPGQAFEVRLKQGELYKGSMFFRTATVTYLVGWFKISLKGLSPQIVEKMKRLQQRGQLVGLFKAASRNGIKAELDNAIQQWDEEENDFENTGEDFIQWNNDVVADITPVSNRKSQLPLRLAE